VSLFHSTNGNKLEAEHWSIFGGSARGAWGYFDFWDNETCWVFYQVTWCLSENTPNSPKNIKLPLEKKSLQCCWERYFSCCSIAGLH